MRTMDCDKLINEAKFDIDKMISIMKLIDHKWVVSDGDYRIPKREEIIQTVKFLIEEIKASPDYIAGFTDRRIESSLGGIHVFCTMTWRDHTNIPGYDYKWEIQYIPIEGSVHI